MKQMKISSVKDVETLLKVFYKHVPRAPRPLHALLSSLFPYITLIAGTLLISIATLPYFFTNYPLDPLAGSTLFSLNMHLTRLLFAVMGTILIISFNKLTRREMVGWYNVFFVTLFHTFFVLVVFQVSSLILLFITWAYLFEIQRDFTDSA